MKEKEINHLIVRELFQNKFKIILTIILFGAVAAVFSFLSPKKYTAFGVVYPTNSNSIKDVINQPDFGYESQADRLIQLFESQMMRDLIIQRFQLVDYYQIDTTQVGWQMLINNKFNQDVTLHRTKYMSVTVSATMKKSDLAANVVNTMISYIDMVRRDLFLKNVLLLETDVNQKLDFQENLVSDLLNKIFKAEGSSSPSSLSNNLLLIIEERKKLGKSLQGDDMIAAKIAVENSIEIDNLINEYYHQLGVLNSLKQDKALVQQKKTQPLPGVYKINEAFESGIKSSPSLLKNTLVGLLFGLLTSIAFIIGKIKWRQLKNSIESN